MTKYNNKQEVEWQVMQTNIWKTKQHNTKII